MRETLALNAYLAQLDNPYVAFAVRQRNPETLDDAVTATLELELYLTPKLTVASVGEQQSGEELATIGAVSGVKSGLPESKIVTMFEKLLDRVEKLEQRGSSQSQSQGRQRPVGRPPEGRGNTGTQVKFSGECWKCGKPGHRARECWSKKKQQGNEKPSP